MTAARRSGWTVLARRLGTCFVVDLAALAATGDWPSTKTLRKNRWLERRLGESGELEFSRVTGAAWSGATFDLLARIEGESWVGRRADARDTKFLHPASREVWARAVRDPDLAGRLACSILHVGGAPAAFTFSLLSGDTLHFIANSYSERFREGSPGRILLYRDLQQAIATGVATVDWGAGDPGYKGEMGAKPGPAIVDLLVVRGGLAAFFARLLWRSREG
jgi:CelD/BcsL family acetyltransferase involved in cellulose biosynthesis